MSYARWGEDSSVYVFGSNDGGREFLVCMHNDESDGGSFTCATPAEMVAHLVAHRERGDIVPDRAFARLHEEMSEGKP